MDYSQDESRSRWYAVGGDLHLFLGIVEKDSNIVLSPESRKRPAEYVKYRPPAPEAIVPLTLT